MKFLDAKEQILDIQITAWGKYLLSQGKMRPVYYSFTDSDVIYDGKFAGYAEVQNDIADRIKDYTPRLEANALFAGIESNVSRTVNKSEVDVDALRFKNEEKQNYACINSLGNGSLTSEEAPAWRLNFAAGKIGNTTTYFTGSEGMQVKIPQLNMKDLQYVVRKRDSYEDGTIVSTKDIVDTKLFEDGTYLSVEGDEILLAIEELNGEFTKTNFDIEMFEVVSGSLGTEQLVQLRFAGDSGVEVSARHVERYFDIDFDKDIKEPFDMEKGRNIYGSRVTKEEVNKVC